MPEAGGKLKPTNCASPIGQNRRRSTRCWRTNQDTIGFDLLFAETLVGLSRDNSLVPIFGYARAIASQW